MSSLTFNVCNNEITLKHFKIIKDGNTDNMPHLEIMEVILIHCNIVNDYYQ